MSGLVPKKAKARVQRGAARITERVTQDLSFVRQDPACDYGVDVVIEAVLDEHPLNYRSRNQLMGRSGFRLTLTAATSLFVGNAIGI